jgi:lipase
MYTYAMQPTLSVYPINGLNLAVYEWSGAGPPIVFHHATSFHARLWDAVIRLLPGRRCLALDARGHGRSDKPALLPRWDEFRDDAAALLHQLGIEGAIGVGHSLGGYVLTRSAARVPEAFRALVLVDPVIFPYDFYSDNVPDYTQHFTMQRRNRWTSPDAMFERFKDRSPFNTWRPEVLRDYCDYGLLPAPDGDGYVLACPPAVEANIYTHSATLGNRRVYEDIATIQVPVRVLRCGRGMRDTDRDLAASPTAPDLASRFAQGVDVVLPNNSHYIPMESPEIVARYVKALIPK